MPVMDFPSSPVNGQTTTDGRYYFDSSVGSSGAWRSTPLPVGGLPAGSIMAWGTNTPPANWLIADGSAVSRATYSSLFAVIGTQYGAGDGTTTFNLPDLRGRVPVGRNGGTFGTLGATGGAETHTLTTAEMPAHNHSATQNTLYYVGSGGQFSSPGGSTVNTNNSAVTGSAGSGSAHNNLQPYQVVNYIIKFSAGWTAGDSELATRLGVVETANATTNRSGLVPIIPTSVTLSSGTASVAADGTITVNSSGDAVLNGIFTSAYRNYKIIFSGNATGNTNWANIFAMRFSSGGTPNSSMNYTYSTWYTQSGSASALNGTGTNTNWMWSGYGKDVVLEIFQPAVSTTGSMLTFTGVYNQTLMLGQCGYNANAAFDGIQFANNFYSGTFRVYGYR